MDAATFIKRALWWFGAWFALSTLLGWEEVSSWYWEAPAEHQIAMAAIIFILINAALVLSGLDGDGSGVPAPKVMDR